MSTLELTEDDKRFWRLKKVLCEDVARKLRGFFKSAFWKKYRVAWGDNPTSGKLFKATIQESGGEDEDIPAIVEEGDTEKFDLATLYYCLLDSHVGLQLPGPVEKGLRLLRKQSNALDDATSTSVLDRDFRERMQEIESNYQMLHLDPAPQDPLLQADYDKLREEKYRKIVRGVSALLSFQHSLVGINYTECT